MKDGDLQHHEALLFGAHVRVDLFKINYKLLEMFGQKMYLKVYMWG